MKPGYFKGIIGAIGLAAVFTVIALALPTIAIARGSNQIHDGVLANQRSNSFDAFTTASATNTLSCREGLAGWEPYLSSGIDIRALGGGTYLDFGANPPGAQLSGMEYIQVIRFRQNKTASGGYLPGYVITPALTDDVGGLGWVIAHAPGSLWLVGNEPDRGPDTPGGPAQDDTYPAVYAQIYHDVYPFIKQRDPSARVAVAGLVEVTPGRLQYLQIVWDTYISLYGTTMPVDVWNMHIYILPETVGIANVALGTDPALAFKYAITHSAGVSNVYTYGDHDNLSVFDSQVRRMRQWMKDHGQQDKPLLLSEFGLLYDENVTDEFGKNFTVPRATTFLTKSFTYLATTTDTALGMPADGNRLVQQWVWFSTHSGVGHISNLVTDTVPLTFTTVGSMFRDNVAVRTLHPNLQALSAGSFAPLLGASESSVTATLSVQFVNNGNQRITVPLTVTFYSDAALTQIINSTVITDGVVGCAGRRMTVSVIWPDLGPGSHPFWVKLDAPDTIAETNETDNVASSQTFVGTHRVYLPLVAKNSY